VRAAARVSYAIAVTAFAACALASDAAAQRTAALAGRVSADSGGAPVNHATIRLPELERVAVTDSGGAFRVDGLPSGSYSVIAEAPGFRARLVRVALTSGAVTTQDFALPRGAYVLAGVDVRAKAPPRVTPKMADFERRRQRGLGWFVTRAELERSPGRRLEEVLRISVPATRFVKSPSGQTWLISSRQALSSNDLLIDVDDGGMRGNVCHVQVVLDGVVISGAARARRAPVRGDGGERSTVSDVRTQTQGGDDPIDFDQFITDQLEAVEFFPDATMTPVEYRTPAAACGTLLLWTRDR